MLFALLSTYQIAQYEVWLVKMVDKLDESDKRLIAALRHDARASISDLAGLLGMSRTTVRARLDRMLARGDIVGFDVVLKEDVAEAAVRGLMMISIEGRGTDRIVRQLQGMPEVRGLHATNGRWDLILEISTDTLAQFDAVLHQVRRIDGVAGSETSLLLSTKKRA